MANRDPKGNHVSLPEVVRAGDVYYMAPGIRWPSMPGPF